MTEGDPEPEYPPITATYEHAAGVRQGEEFPTTYVRFGRQPPDIVLRTINGRFSFYWSKIRRTWRGPRENWPDCEAFLKAEGLEVVAGSVGDGMTRRDRQARDKKREQAAAEEGPTLENFDWSDFATWAPENLKIVQRQTTKFAPFVLNEDQVRFVEACADQKRRTGKVRKIVIKRRQRGISTGVQGLFYYITKHVPHVESLVMAHDAEAGDKIFLRVKEMYRNDPNKLETGKTGRDNKREHQYDSPFSSALRVLTPTEGSGHGGTRQLVHLTELPLWGSCAPSALNGILNSVPDGPGTIVIIEAAAKGIGNLFHKKYVEAKDGLSDFEVFFIDWLGHEDCSLDVPLSDPRFANLPPEWTEDEDRLRSLGYRDSQLAWRRRAIPDKCLGSPEMFKQEYPATADEAFLSTGSNVFPPSIVDPEWKRLVKVEQQNPAPRYAIMREREEKEPGRLVETRNGALRVWKEPEDGVPYLISVDVGRGLNVSADSETEKLDYTTMRVVSEWPDANGVYEESAVWHGRMDPDKATGQLDFLGRWYNNALATVEANHYGILMLGFLLKKYRYPRVYRREKIDQGTRAPVTQDPDGVHFMRHGWFTGPSGGVTKAEMIELLHILIRDRRFRIHEPEAWAEMATYLRAPDGTTNAAPGEFDDRIMALAIAACVLHFHPRTRTSKGPDPDPPKVSADGTALIINARWITDRSKAKREKERRLANGGGWA